MKHFKRWISFLLVLCMGLSVTPIQVFAESTEVASGICGENQWSIFAEYKDV